MEEKKTSVIFPPVFGNAHKKGGGKRGFPLLNGKGEKRDTAILPLPPQEREGEKKEKGISREVEKKKKGKGGRVFFFSPSPIKKDMRGTIITKAGGEMGGKEKRKKRKGDRCYPLQFCY